MRPSAGRPGKPACGARVGAAWVVAADAPTVLEGDVTGGCGGLNGCGGDYWINMGLTWTFSAGLRRWSTPVRRRCTRRGRRSVGARAPTTPRPSSVNRAHRQPRGMGDRKCLRRAHHRYPDERLADEPRCFHHHGHGVSGAQLLACLDSVVGLDVNAPRTATGLHRTPMTSASTAATGRRRSGSGKRQSLPCRSRPSPTAALTGPSSA